jgi:hypothetical protein
VISFSPMTIEGFSSLWHENIKKMRMQGVYFRHSRYSCRLVSSCLSKQLNNLMLESIKIAFLS